MDALELFEKFLLEKFFYLRKIVKVENVQHFREITVHRELCISYCVCNKLTISLSEDKIELDQIVQRAVVNETALTTSPDQLLDQSQELFGIARPPTDKAPSAASLAPTMAAKGIVNQQGAHGRDPSLSLSQVYESERVGE